MDKAKVKVIIKEIVYLAMQLLFSKINILNIVNSVGLPFAFINLYFGGNIFVGTFGYLLSKAYLFSSLKPLLITAYEVIILALYYFAKEFVKTNKQLLLVCIFTGLSSVAGLYYATTSINLLAVFFINFILDIILIIFFYKFYSVYKNKFIFFKFSKNDYLLSSVMISLLAMGLFSYKFVSLYIGLFFIVYFALFFAKILAADKYFIWTTMLSIGAVIVTNNIMYLSLSVLCSVVFVQIKEINKYIYALINLIFVGIFVLIFRIFNVFSIISIIFAFFVFLLVPNNVCSKISQLFENSALSILFNYLQSEQIISVKQKLFLMSSTFLNMQNNLKFLLVGKIDRQKACSELTQDVINKCCKECENFRYCFFENINKKSMFENLMSVAIENKQVSLSDMSNGLQAYCKKSGIVANEINHTAKLFLLYENQMKTEDSSKLMIASELGNVSDIFLNFAKLLKNSLKINEKLSKTLKDAFSNNLVDVKEVLILENENGIESINIIACNEEIMKRELSDTIYKTVRNRVRIKKTQHLDYSGLSLVTFVIPGRLKLNFAVATKSKEAKNGDNAIITKISDNKYFVAIADGMGHGENANKISSMVISLIKSMFEVGLDDELILQSVNKLLLPAGLENFTTLDACIIDLESEVATFVKLGASVSILKHSSTSEIINCKSLPIGIVQNINPTITKKQLLDNDMIFLASDGVVDSFSSPEAFKCFVNDSKIYNLQKFLDDVIFDAESLNTKHPDDMTIIGINLLKN